MSSSLFLKLSAPEYTAELGISGRMKVAVLIALKLGYGVKCVDGEGYLGEVFFWGRRVQKNAQKWDPPKDTRFQVQSDKAKNNFAAIFPFIQTIVLHTQIIASSLNTTYTSQLVQL